MRQNLFHHRSIFLKYIARRLPEFASVGMYGKDRVHRTRVNLHGNYFLYSWLPFRSKNSRIGRGGHVCQDFETGLRARVGVCHALNIWLVSTHDDTEVIVASLEPDQRCSRRLLRRSTGPKI